MLVQPVPHRSGFVIAALRLVEVAQIAGDPHLDGLVSALGQLDLGVADLNPTDDDPALVGLWSLTPEGQCRDCHRQSPCESGLSLVVLAEGDLDLDGLRKPGGVLDEPRKFCVQSGLDRLILASPATKSGGPNFPGLLVLLDSQRDHLRSPRKTLLIISLFQL